MRPGVGIGTMRYTLAQAEAKETAAACEALGVDASGEQPLPEWMTGSYQREKGRPGVVPYAIINPIRVAPGAP